MKTPVRLFNRKNEYQISTGINVGTKRFGKPNQDTVQTLLPGWFNSRPPLLVLSDGMGGYGGGEVASRIAVETMLRVYRGSDLSAGFLVVLEKGVLEAHQAIASEAAQDERIAWMGCTIVAAILTQDEIFLANVGDSRAYLINRDSVEQISHDHSLVADQLRAGLITEEEAKNHPKKNILSLSLTGRREKAPPFLSTVKWKPGDSLLLCSDGLWGPVSETQIQSIVLELDYQRATEKLVTLANTRGGPDNISVILAQHKGTKPISFEDLEETSEGVYVVGNS